MVHDLSPTLLPIYGDIGIRWYGLSYIAGFVFSYYFISWISARQNRGLTKEKLSDFVTYGAIGVLVGGRLGYCLFYAPDLFLQFRSSFPFWGVLAVNEGGMASHGGIIGLVVGTTLFALKSGLPQAYLYDLIALVGGMGVMFGRLANYVNGELVGRIAPPGTTWAVKFPQDILSWPSYEPQRLASLGDTVATLPGHTKEQYLQWLAEQSTSPQAHQMVQSTLHSIVDAIQRGNEATKAAIALVLDARYPSQLIAAAGEGLIIFVILFALAYKARKPGVIGSIYVVLYAIMRIITEQYRMPDAHIGFQALGLTRGQWLSVAMLLVGLGLLFYYGRRETLKTPGWGRGQHIKIGRR